MAFGNGRNSNGETSRRNTTHQLPGRWACRPSSGRNDAADRIAESCDHHLPINAERPENDSTLSSAKDDLGEHESNGLKLIGLVYFPTADDVANCNSHMDDISIQFKQFKNYGRWRRKKITYDVAASAYDLYITLILSGQIDNTTDVMRQSLGLKEYSNSHALLVILKYYFGLTGSSATKYAQAARYLLCRAVPPNVAAEMLGEYGGIEQCATRFRKLAPRQIRLEDNALSPDHCANADVAITNQDKAMAPVESRPDKSPSQPLQSRAKPPLITKMKTPSRREEADCYRQVVATEAVMSDIDWISGKFVMIAMGNPNGTVRILRASADQQVTKSIQSLINTSDAAK